MMSIQKYYWMLHENVSFELKVKHFCHRMVVAKESEGTRHASCWDQTHNIAASWEQVIALFFSTYKNWDIRGSGKLMSSKRKDFRSKAACFMLQGCELHRWVKWSQWANWMNGWYRKFYRSGEKQRNRRRTEVSWFAFNHFDNDSDPKQHGEKKFISSSTLWSIIRGRWGRNSSSEDTRSQELKWKPGRNDAVVTCSPGLLSFPSYRTQNYLLKTDSTIYRGPRSSHSCHQSTKWANLMYISSQLKFPLPAPCQAVKT